MLRSGIHLNELLDREPGTQMKRFRLFLLPAGALAELSVLACCWVVALVNPRAAERMMETATEVLPPIDWYTGAV